MKSIDIEVNKEYISFFEDEIELKFYFMLGYEDRISLIEKSAEYIKQSIEKVLLPS